eukprot:571672-Prymnesium_polylepis.1
MSAVDAHRPRPSAPRVRRAQQRTALSNAVFDGWMRAMGVGDDDRELILARWPFAEPPPEQREALDPDGPWGASASGVEIRECSEPGKGRGAFATRPFAEGEFIGLYWGEMLTQREFTLRHGWKSWHHSEAASPKEELDVAKRLLRLRPLTPETGCPIGRDRNGG